MTYKPVDPVAFAIAFISAPIVFTVMYFWVLFIPVFAFILGGIPYLIIGLPLLMWHMLFHEPDEDKLHRFTLKSIFLAGGIAMALSVIANRPEIFGYAAYCTVFGAMIGPLWSIQFCRIYLSLQRPKSGHAALPIPS